MTTLLLQSGDRQLYNLGTSRNIFYNEILTSHITVD